MHGLVLPVCLIRLRLRQALLLTPLPLVGPTDDRASVFRQPKPTRVPTHDLPAARAPTSTAQSSPPSRSSPTPSEAATLPEAIAVVLLAPLRLRVATWTALRPAATVSANARLAPTLRKRASVSAREPRTPARPARPLVVRGGSARPQAQGSWFPRETRSATRDQGRGPERGHRARGRAVQTADGYGPRCHWRTGPRRSARRALGGCPPAGWVRAAAPNPSMSPVGSATR
jgi:hypothetical protein